MNLKQSVLLIAMAGLALGQAVPVQTTLVNAVDAQSTVVQIANTSGIQPGYLLYTDREAMAVAAVSGPAVTVTRGAAQTRITGHAGGTAVYAAPLSAYVTVDPEGACFVASTAILINARSGNTSACTAGVWVITSPNAGSGGGGGGGGSATSATYAVNFTQAALRSAGLTATVPMAALPAGAMIVGTVIVSEMAFAATSMTSLKVSLGDASGPTVWSRNTTFDLLQTVTATAFLADGGFGATTTASDTLNLYFTAVGANISTLSAGKFHVTILYMPAPGTVTTL